MSGSVPWKRYLVSGLVAVAVMWGPWVGMLVEEDIPDGNPVAIGLGIFALPALMPGAVASFEMPFGDLLPDFLDLDALVDVDMEEFSPMLFLWVALSAVMLWVLTYLGSRGKVWLVVCGLGCLSVEIYSLVTFLGWMNV